MRGVLCVVQVRTLGPLAEAPTRGVLAVGDLGAFTFAFPPPKLALPPRFAFTFALPPTLTPVAGTLRFMFGFFSFLLLSPPDDESDDDEGDDSEPSFPSDLFLTLRKEGLASLQQYCKHN